MPVICEDTEDLVRFTIMHPLRMLRNRKITNLNDKVSLAGGIFLDSLFS
jgi:hypothetical protein